MAVHFPHFSKQPRVEVQRFEDETEVCDYIEPSHEDVEAFLEADTEAALQSLMHKYSPLFYSAYLAPSVPMGKSETIDDYSNLRTLLSIGVKLRALIEEPEIDIQNVEGLGIVTMQTRSSEACSDALVSNANRFLSLTIELKLGHGTRRFLEAGINHVGYGRVLHEPSNSSDQSPMFSLEVNSMPFSDASLNHWGYSWICGSLLDALSAIMLHDISTKTNMGIPYQSSQSIASSFWYMMTEQFREGRAGSCQVCGKPFISLDERKNKRLYCSPACNKMHQRLVRFKKLTKEGYSDKDAAKKAGVKLERALNFWKHRNEPTDTSAK